MDRNDKNLLDDTGREMVNALRRIAGVMTGQMPEMEKINYRDNNFNLLDKTGKKIVAGLEAIADSVTVSGPAVPATEEHSGLMSAEDKAKLNAFGPANTYLTIDMLTAMGAAVVDTEDELPEAVLGQLALVRADNGLRIYNGQDWQILAEPGMTEQDILQIIREESEAIEEP